MQHNQSLVRTQRAAPHSSALSIKMKRAPSLYVITGKSTLAKTILYYKIGLVVLVLCVCAFLVTILENKIFLFLNQIFTISAVNLIVCFNRNPTLKIHPLSGKISYIYGLRSRFINSGNLKSLSLENDIVFQTKKDKRIIIRLKEFPNIDIQKLKDNFQAIFIEKKPVKDVFLSNPVDGFKVVNKTILETKNPWPQVLLIFSCVAVVLYLLHMILN